MASQKAKVFFAKVLDKAAKLLMEEAGLPARAAVAEADGMCFEAFDRALNLAMEESERKAVQCDWLVVIAGRFLWVVACEHCGYSLETMPPIGDLVVPARPMKGDDATASPDHLRRIKHALETFVAQGEALKQRQKEIMEKLP
ncbi:hypothetical protein KVR01_004635 [Diaporthe batatas]|uniref:uncharacterized protein n=1 Tax=Diaporthe batatas TaxID=748121 RepID=UPI001D05A98A|nr:uncharacterized protein KVR01_004635 [Diaporthe batatas]KAG8166083.1 hypothetical protein KVR01_004635 [Diaporthe batatas]